MEKGQIGIPSTRDGSQTRSFCFVDDMFDGFTGPVNLGNLDEFTIKELADQILDMIRSKSKLKFQPLPDDDPKQRKPDISLAQNQLGWEPKVNLKEGLMQVIEYFDGYMRGQCNV